MPRGNDVCGNGYPSGGIACHAISVKHYYWAIQGYRI